MFSHPSILMQYNTQYRTMVSRATRLNANPNNLTETIASKIFLLLPLFHNLSVALVDILKDQLQEMMASKT